MKKITVIIISILAVLLIAESVFLFTEISQKYSLMNEVSSIQNEVTRIQAERDTLNQQVNVMATQVADYAVQVEDLTAEKDEYRNKFDDANTSVLELAKEKENLNNQLMCFNQISTVDFSSNKTVNDALVEYVKEMKGISDPISAHYWNLIWTGENYSIHTIEVNSEKDRTVYLWKFTVYFRGEAYGNHENGIFYNDEQCWVYLDK